MRDDEPDYLSEIIFKQTLREQLQFEGSAAPILATLVILTAPSGVQGLFITGAVVGLVIIAFLRWLTFTGRFANEELFIEKTVRPTELFAIIGVVQLLTVVSKHLLPLVPLSIVETTAVVAIIGAMGSVVFIEVVFGTYRLGWGSLFYLHYRAAMDKTGNLDSAEKVKHSAESLHDLFTLMIIVVLGRVYLETAYYALRNAIPEDRDKYIEELHEFVEQVDQRKSSNFDWGLLGTVILATFVVVPVLGVIGWILSFAFATTGVMLLTLVIMRITKHIVGFSYIAFGTLRFDQFITSNRRSAGLYITYTGVIYLLFYYPI